jgi:hypothetical protein
MRRAKWLANVAALGVITSSLSVVGIRATEHVFIENDPAAAEFPPADRRAFENVKAGRTTKLLARVLRSPSDSAASVHLLLQYLKVDEALAMLHRTVEEHPERMAEAFERVSRNSAVFTEKPRYKEQLQALLVLARLRLSALSHEEAARAERALMNLDWAPPAFENRWENRLPKFVREYAGTEAALLAEIDLILWSTEVDEYSVDRKIEALGAFVAAHPGTVAGTKALYMKGYLTASKIPIRREDPVGSDPTERLLRTLSIIKELESGKYPPCEWVEQAPSIAVAFVAPDFTFGPGSLDRAISEFVTFARTHLVLNPGNPAQRAMGTFVTSNIPKLLKLRGDGMAGVERFFADFERHASNPTAVRYLHAQYYMQAMISNAADPLLLQKARESLAVASNDKRGLYSRKALATLAMVDFAQRDLPRARTSLQRYLRSYPKTDWAWLAALRLGQVIEESGNARTAAETYLAAASTYRALPIAKVLGHEFAARAFERLGMSDRALTEHQHALAAWDDDYGTTYSIYTWRRPRQTDSLAIALDEADISKKMVQDRVAQLMQSLAAPGGPSPEPGR